MTTSAENIRQTLYAIRDGAAPSELRALLLNAVRELSPTIENRDLYKLVFELISRIEDPSERNNTLIAYVAELPTTDAFRSIFVEAMEAAIIAADALVEPARRATELVRLAKELPATKGFQEARILAWRLALGLSDRPRYKEPDIARIGAQLPKPNDYTYYRRYTLMGVLKEMPRDPELDKVYVEAMTLTLKGAATIKEQYYRRLGFTHIALEVSDKPALHALHLEALAGAYESAMDMADVFAREHALIEVLQLIPKGRDYLPLIEKTISEALSFFTLRRWAEDIDALDVVDSILAAEDHSITDARKKRYDREKYAHILSEELDKFGAQLNDTRLIETLRPYSHVWVQPRGLRDAVKSVINRLEALKGLYHGMEVERPEFVAETYTGAASGRYIHRKQAAAASCIAIDLGATNTVVMRKKEGAPPDFVQLASIAVSCDGAYSVPTILSAETNKIGAEVIEDFPIVNIKQMMLDANPRGRVYMERYLRILSQHLKKATINTAWFAFKGAKDMADVIYVTVPVGYQYYRSAIKEMAEAVFKGVKIEVIEEPLAAAVGYQVIEQRDKVVMVIDFGGSTLNTMLVRVNLNEVHVVAKPDRAKILGGRDIDEWLAQHLAQKAGLRLEGVPYKLLSAAEEVKIALSRSEEVPFVWDGREVGRITRSEFEEMLDNHEFYKLIDRTMAYVLRKAGKVGVRPENIEAVLLTGGSSQIPSFKEKIGQIFPHLRESNCIYDHSPLTAVGNGAALYGTRDILDRHLGLAYAVRYATVDKVEPFSYSVVLEKGELLPLEKTYRMKPAQKLGGQKGLTIELFEVPESMIQRAWVMEGGIEFLKQEFKPPVAAGGTPVGLTPVKPVTITFNEPVTQDVHVTFAVAESGELSVKYGTETVNTGIRLQ
ncbi:MAG: Hsp70 family protein [Deltaproteobacteria bacterium]|nr:Hsp70 family protein [Deltaproteobacteria bacterium]